MYHNNLRSVSKCICNIIGSNTYGEVQTDGYDALAAARTCMAMVSGGLSRGGSGIGHKGLVGRPARYFIPRCPGTKSLCMVLKPHASTLFVSSHVTRDGTTAPYDHRLLRSRIQGSSVRWANNLILKVQPTKCFARRFTLTRSQIAAHIKLHSTEYEVPVPGTKLGRCTHVQGSTPRIAHELAHLSCVAQAFKTCADELRPIAEAGGNMCSSCSSLSSSFWAI